VVTGLVLSMAICAVTPFNNSYLEATPLGGGHFPLAPFVVLVLMTPATALVNRLCKQRLFTGTELLLVWMQMVLGSGIAWTGLARTFFINVTAPLRFATVENRWAEELMPLLPASWYPRNMDAVELLHNGLENGRDMGWLEVAGAVPWDAWLGPLLTWGGFILLCYFVMICVINVFMRQWIHNERIHFPLLRVPHVLGRAVDEDGVGALFTNPFLLCGLFLPLALHTLNGLHFYFPAVPQLPTLILAGPYFPKQGLFSGFHKLKIYIYPAFVGFAFLASKQISFSFWFFFIAGGLLVGLLGVLGYNIPAASLGVTFGPTLSRPDETQMIGAYGVFFLFLVWLARKHLWLLARQSLGLAKLPAVHTEWFDPRLAAWGTVAGMSAITLWCVHFGMPPLPALLLVAAFFMVMLVASRVICQGGLAYFTLTAAPTDGLLAFFGPGFFTSAGLAVGAVAQKVLFVDLRESLMPSLLHASEVNRRMKNKKKILAGIALTLVAGVAVSFVSMLVVCHKYGVRGLQLDWATNTTIAVYENIHNLARTPVQPGHWVTLFTIAGALVMLALVTCYHRFYWWPLHPIGYLTAYSSSMRILWFSFFIGWLCNTLCMRYGGVVLFKRLRFFFLGLIIGDFLMGGLWAVVGVFAGTSYQILPG